MEVVIYSTCINLVCDLCAHIYSTCVLYRESLSFIGGNEIGPGPLDETPMSHVTTGVP
jgi:hypothetical protein